MTRKKVDRGQWKEDRNVSSTKALVGDVAADPWSALVKS